MGSAVKLPDADTVNTDDACAEISDSLHHVRLVFQHGCLVAVDIEVVWRRKDGHD
jgi:hypothetical protein